MTAGTIVVTSRSFGSGNADPDGWLATRGYRVQRADHRHDPAALTGPLADAVGWIAGTGPVGRAQLDLAPKLRVVARYGVGTDAVDRAELERRGITLTNTPGANTDAVADHTLGLLLAALRHTLDGDRTVRTGASAPGPGRELGSCTVGLIGLGAIGQAVHRRLRAFGARVVAFDPFVDDPPAEVELVDLDWLAAAADVISLHRPPADAPVVGIDLLRRVRAGAVLVNTARAELIDEDAVAAALHDGRLGAAALDVLATEHGTKSPLLDAPNVVLTPHIAGHTTDAIDRMGTRAAEDIVRVLAGEPPQYPVPPPTRHQQNERSAP
jgi:D-3-phosphoglycerate dehydrogenase / 2-oxoglutarate reductase